MAFRPDTKYYIGSKEYDTIYEAFDAVRTMAKGTVKRTKMGPLYLQRTTILIPITFISLTSIMESRQIRTIPLERCFLALPTTAMERC